MSFRGAAPTRRATFAAEVGRLPKGRDDVAGKATSIHFGFEDGSHATADFHAEYNGSGLVSLGLSKAADKTGKKGLLRFQQRCLELLKLHFVEARVYSAELRNWVGGGALCIPDVPSSPRTVTSRGSRRTLRRSRCVLERRVECRGPE